MFRINPARDRPRETCRLRGPLDEAQGFDPGYTHGRRPPRRVSKKPCHRRNRHSLCSFRGYLILCYGEGWRKKEKGARRLGAASARSQKSLQACAEGGGQIPQERR